MNPTAWRIQRYQDGKMIQDSIKSEPPDDVMLANMRRYEVVTVTLLVECAKAQKEMAALRAQVADLTKGIEIATELQNMAQSDSEKCERDAMRYRWLRDNKFNSLYLDRNDDISTNYTTAKEWIEERVPEWFEDCDPVELQAMKDTDTIWSIQIYPDTPIGSYTMHGATLDHAIDAAITTMEKDHGQDARGSKSDTDQTA